MKFLNWGYWIRNQWSWSIGWVDVRWRVFGKGFIEIMEILCWEFVVMI
jgi:hypothetical protein